MPALVLAIALVGATPASHDACANVLIRQTAAVGAPHARKLGDLPPARLMHAVLRRIDGCEVAEVRQADGVWVNVPAGSAFAPVQPARASPPPP